MCGVFYENTKARLENNMNFKINFDDEYFLIKLSIYSLSFILCIVFLIEQTIHPARYDAEQYMSMANTYLNTGMDTNIGNLRTYLYPFILSILIKISKLISFSDRMLIMLFQYFLYLIACVSLSNSISTNQLLHTSILASLMLNIYTLPYISITLTDSVYLSLTLLWMSYLIKFDSCFAKDEKHKHVHYILWATFLSALILVLRPAGIWVVMANFIMLIYYGFAVLNKYQLFKINFIKTFAITIILITAFIIPLVPQIHINTLHFNIVTPFPAGDLGSSQLSWGVNYLKYATNLSGGKPQLYYKNPFYTKDTSTKHPDPIDWYTHNPIESLQTLGTKFVGAFDFDYLFVYIYNLNPPYRWYSAFISLSFMYFGMWGIFSYLIAFKTEDDHNIMQKFTFGSRIFPFVCLLTWAAVIIPSAIELRFSLPLLSVFIVFTLERIFYLSNLSVAKKIFHTIVYAICMSEFLLIADFISRTKVL